MDWHKYQEDLLRVPPASSEVCDLCHDLRAGADATCPKCRKQIRLGGVRPSATIFMSLAVQGTRFGRDLYNYKRSDDPRSKDIADVFGEIFYRWLTNHEKCLARSSGIEHFDVVTWVPSDRTNHPMSEIASKNPSVQRRLTELLTRKSVSDEQRRHAVAGRFLCLNKVESPSSVLLLDDTFVSGAQCLSAVAALKEAGYGPIGVACMGRWLDPAKTLSEGDRERTLALIELSKIKPWSFLECPLCDK
jgi:predicted amidophosphoribosyltransferase